METIYIGLLGGGTVGSGVVRVLRDNADAVAARLGVRLEVRRIAVLDLDKPRDEAVDAALLTTDADEVLDDPSIAIVVELVGGVTDAADYVLRAIARKKHVVTANKALLARRGAEIFALAREAGVEVFYEGAVCGGIPIIRALRESLASDRVRSLAGIVNGTTNYILTAMSQAGASFDATLVEAQRLGYAEADPSADVDGHDAGQKLAILAALAFGTSVEERDVAVEGIREVRAEDIAAADRFGYAIKLLAIAERVGDAIALRVHPTWVSRDGMLAHVDGVFNAVSLESEALGTSLFYGRGAGQLPTGSAVAADVIDVARSIRIGAAGRVARLGAETRPSLAKLALSETVSAFYLRFLVDDVPGVLGRIATVLGRHGVSLRTVHQDVRGAGGHAVPVVALSHPTRERDLSAALAEIDAHAAHRAPTRVMRILEGV